MKELPKKLTIGCGKRPCKGYYNTDLLKLQGVDQVLNLDKFPYKLPKNHFTEIIADNVLEHVDDFCKTLKEIHKLLAPGGKLIIRVPHFTYSGAYTDPTHKHFFTYHSFDYFVKKAGEYDFYFDFWFSSSKVKISFGKRIAIWNWIIEPLANWFPGVYENSPMRMFPAEELHVTLTK
jgi:SAM-dependent methyltransferase